MSAEVAYEVEAYWSASLGNLHKSLLFSKSVL